MANAGHALGARIRRLEQAFEQANKMSADMTLSFEPMRELLGVSRQTLTAWANDITGFEDSGVFARGGNGIEWVFQPAATVGFLLHHFESERDTRRAASQAQRDALGQGILDGVPVDATTDELLKIVKLRGELVKQMTREQTLVERSRVQQLLDTMIAEMQRAYVQAIGEKDPTNEWPVEIGESYRVAIDQLIVDIAKAGEKAVAGLRDERPA